jgi:large subunit ribosomal protein L15
LKVKSKRPFNKKRKRVGRGPGSGSGKTSGRGHKGQHSRSGSGKSPGFEGGQMTYVRRLPKRGFSNARFKKDIDIVNISTIAQVGETEITPAVLASKGLVAKKIKPLKVLGTGKIDKAVTVHADFFSENAQKKIEAAGGKAVLLNEKK